MTVGHIPTLDQPFGLLKESGQHRNGSSYAMQAPKPRLRYRASGVRNEPVDDGRPYRDTGPRSSLALLRPQQVGARPRAPDADQGGVRLGIWLPTLDATHGCPLMATKFDIGSYAPWY
jgi:hypothetical protein